MRYLLLYNKENEVESLLSEFKGELNHGVFNSNLKYVQVPQPLFEELTKRYKYSIKLKSNVEVNKNLTIEDFDFTLLPEPIPPRPSKEQILAIGLMENTLSNAKLKKQVDTLAKAIFELTLEKGE